MDDKKVWVYFHSADLDGKCSGALAKLFLEEAGKEVTLCPINYGEDPYKFNVPEGSLVYVLDFSFPVQEFVEFCKKYMVIWIDHHERIINEIKDFIKNNHEHVPSIEIRSYSEVDGKKVAACMLTWRHFSIKPFPRFVQLLSDYDVFCQDDKKKWEEEILPFQYGCRNYETSPVNNYKFWTDIISYGDVDIDEIIHEGKNILFYQKQQNAHNASARSYEIEWEGYRWVAMNGVTHTSMSFDSVFEHGKHDGMLVYTFMKKNWVVSLYSPENGIDVSIIAKKNGGGGHTHASGFQPTSIDQFLPEKK